MEQANNVALERLRRLVLQEARTFDKLPFDLSHVMFSQPRRTRGERRDCRRINVCLPIRFRTASGPRALDAAIGDLSKGGVFMRSLAPAAAGETVAGGFVIVGADRRYQVRFRGRVAWVAGARAAFPPGPGIGVDFDKVRVTILPRA